MRAPHSLVSFAPLVAALLMAVVLGACADSGDREPSPLEGVTTRTPTIERTAPDIDPGVQRWEAEICRVVQSFRSSFLALNDGVDPHLLTVEERQARSERQFPTEIALASEALTHLESVEPPEQLARLHGALEDAYRSAIDAITERRAAVAAATTAEEIDRANPPARSALDAAFGLEPLLQQGGYCQRIDGTS